VTQNGSLIRSEHRRFYWHTYTTYITLRCLSFIIPTCRIKQCWMQSNEQPLAGTI